jgi:ABC-type phosphate/phosphonate transport system substrate-binding protein
VTSVALGFYLGEALRPVADAIARGLGQRLGIDVSFDATGSDADLRHAIEQGVPGVWWLCGLQTLELQDRARDLVMVAAPVFHGQPGPVYHSVLVVGASRRVRTLADLAGTVLAINEPGSWSGHHALRAMLAERGVREPLFRDVLVTGTHTGSIDALLSGSADIAAIDHTVWTDRLARDTAVASLRVLGRTADWPAPPFSISGGLEPGLARAIREGLVDLRPPGLDAIVVASERDYQPLRTGMAASRSLAW